MILAKKRTKLGCTLHKNWFYCGSSKAELSKFSWKNNLNKNVIFFFTFRSHPMRSKSIAKKILRKKNHSTIFSFVHQLVFSTESATRRVIFLFNKSPSIPSINLNTFRFYRLKILFDDSIIAATSGHLHFSNHSISRYLHTACRCTPYDWIEHVGSVFDTTSLPYGLYAPVGTK